MLYDKIKYICKQRGISIRSVEKEAGLKNGALSKWNASSPMIDNLASVCKILNVSIDTLVNEEQPEQIN